jgi:hypothetical protein
VDWEPRADFTPDHAPEALHEVALVADQFSVALLPLITELGLTLRLMTGAGFFTDTAADCVALPPALVQVKV